MSQHRNSWIQAELMIRTFKYIEITCFCYDLRRINTVVSVKISVLITIEFLREFEVKLEKQVEGS